MISWVTGGLCTSSWNMLQFQSLEMHVERGIQNTGMYFILLRNREEPQAARSIWSHNHRLGEVERDLWRSSCSTPLLKQGHLQPVVQVYVQMFLWRSPRMETPSPPRCITGPLAAIKSNQIWNSHESLLPIKSPLQNTFSWRQHGFKCCWTEENNPQGFLPLNSIHRKQTQTALRWWQMCSQAHFIQMCHSGSTGSRERKLWPLGIWYHIAEFSSHSSPMTHYA